MILKIKTNKRLNILKIKQIKRWFPLMNLDLKPTWKAQKIKRWAGIASTKWEKQTTQISWNSQTKSPATFNIRTKCLQHLKDTKWPSDEAWNVEKEWDWGEMSNIEIFKACQERRRRPRFQRTTSWKVLPRPGWHHSSPPAPFRNPRWTC